MVKNNITTENLFNYEIIIRLKSGPKAIELLEVEQILCAGMPTFAELGSAKTQDEIQKFADRMELYHAAFDAVRQRPINKSIRRKGIRRSQRIKK